ncbi:MAG: hypothetical protein ACI965_001746, partial [Paraglaciecola sp.]
LKCVFNAGGFKSALATPAPLSDGYMIIVSNSHKKQTIISALTTNHGFSNQFVPQ